MAGRGELRCPSQTEGTEILASNFVVEETHGTWLDCLEPLGVRERVALSLFLLARDC